MLQKQTVSVGFQKGLDTKTDPNSVVAGKFLLAENIIFTRPGSFRKRNGYRALSSSVGIPQTATLAAGQALAVYQNELLACDKSSVYSYDVSGQAWISKGAFASVNVTQTAIVRNSNQQTQQDSTTHPSGLQCFVWEDTQGGSRYSVVDQTTGQAVVPSTLILSTAIKPKVLSIGSFAVILYVNTADTKLYVAPLSVAAPTAALVPVAITAPSGFDAILSSSAYDASVVNTIAGPRLYVSFGNASGATSIFAMAANNPTVVVAKAYDPNIPSALTVFADSAAGGPVLAYYSGTSSSVGYHAFDYALSAGRIATPTVTSLIQGTGTLAAGTYWYRVSALNTSGETLASAEQSCTIAVTHGVTITWSAVPGATLYNVYGRTSGAELRLIQQAGTSFTDSGAITPGAPLPVVDSTAGLKGGAVESSISSVVSVSGVSVSSASTALRFFYTVSAGSTYNYRTRTNTITGSAYTAGTPKELLRSVALAGKAFVYNGTAFAVLAYQSPLQPTYFVADGSGNLVAKLLYGLGGGIPIRTDGKGAPVLSETNALAGGTQFQIALLAKDALIVQSGQQFTQTGVESLTLNFFDTANSYLRAQIGQNLHFSGGFLQMYDGGGAPVEHGFHLFPEPVTVPNPGGVNVYQYVACYEWTDNQGQTHRSSPSVAVTQAQAAAISGGATVTVTIPTLRLTAKQSRAAVSCVVYRTVSNGTSFYQASSTTSPTANSVVADTVTFVDATTDAALIGNPQLYTTGSVLPNIEPNAVSALVVHRNRLWTLDSTNPLQWWVSKQIQPPAIGVNTPPAEFSDFLLFPVDPTGGNCTAGASLDDKFIIFKASSIFYTYGDGPDSTGGGSTWPNAQVVTTDCGCVNPRSIVLTPTGLMFQTQKGIYLLNRGLQVSYVGADVEAYNGATVTSAQLIATTNQVRFTLSSGVALVYDYLMQQWCVFTPLNAVDSAIWQGVYTYLAPAGVAYQETPGMFADAGNYIKLRVVTSWLQFAGVQGFQRAYKALLLGNYMSPHQLLVQVAYDFNPAFIQQDYITPSAGPAYGGDVTYGGGPDTVYGGSFPLYQYRIALAQQKCQAIQLSIEDIGTGTIGEGLSLSSMGFEIGLKKGLAKTPASNTVG